MQRNRNAPSPADGREALVEQIRANVAFEQIVVSVLAGAGICGLVFFGLQVIGLFVGGSFSMSTLLSAVLAAVVFAFLFFLIGFAAGAAIVTPLFRMLENSRRRSGWPYGAAAMAVAVLSLIIAGALPAAQAPGASAIISVIGATLATSVIFARLMAPHWAAAEAEERRAAATHIEFTLR